MEDTRRRSDEENDKDDEATAEDRPQFRSTAMAVMRPSDPFSAPSFSPGQPYSSAFHNNNNDDYLRMADLRIGNRGAPSNILNRNVPRSPDKSSSTWKVTSLTSVPTDYTLKRGYRQVQGQPQVVSGRISDCLRSRSIHAEYAQDKALATCQTADNVHIRIRLFTGKDDGTVLVHVHRMKGCGFSFREDCSAILDAAQDVKVGNRGLPDPSAFTIPPSILQKDSKPLDIAFLKQSVADCAAHLQPTNKQHNKRELQVFALEHIAAMTDPTKSSQSTSKAVSQIIMMNPEGVRKSLAILLITGSLTDETSEKTSERYNDTAHAQEMKSLGLAILSNIMMALSKDGTLDHVMQGEAENAFFTNDLMPALLRDVRNYELCPHCSSLAAKSLSVLFQHSSMARKRCKNVDGNLAALMNAVEYGARSHASLHQEATNAILNVGKH